MITNIKRVVRFGRYYRFEHLEGKRFIVIALINAVMATWGLMVMSFPLNLLAIVNVAAVIVALIMFIRENIVTMPDWAKDVWNGKD